MSDNELQGFSVQMALVDMIPVLLFGISMLLIANSFDSMLFLLGAVCSCLAGLGKVLWKIIIALFHKEVDFFAMQFKYVMSIGFICMIGSVFFERRNINFDILKARITGMPSVLCFGGALVGMVMMIVLGLKMDQHDSRMNWIEQCLNIGIQLLVLIGIILA